MPEGTYELTRLEVSIVELLLEGLDDGQIALQLELADNDMRESLQAIMLKTNTRSRTAAAIKCLKAGIMKDDDEGWGWRHRYRA